MLFINNFIDDFVHVVGCVRVFRNQGVQRVIRAISRIIKWPGWGARGIVGRQQIDKVSRHHQDFDIVLKAAIANA